MLLPGKSWLGGYSTSDSFSESFIKLPDQTEKGYNTQLYFFSFESAYFLIYETIEKPHHEVTEIGQKNYRLDDETS